MRWIRGRLGGLVLVATWTASCTTSRAGAPPLKPPPPKPQLSVNVRPPEPTSPLLAALERTACEGTCPVYSIRVYEDGTVIYCGMGYVLTRGYRTARISSKSLDSIRAAFRSVDFLQFAYECEHGDDAPAAEVFYREDGRARLIYHPSDCEPDTSGLLSVEAHIDAIVDSNRWVGADDPKRFAEDARELDDRTRRQACDVDDVNPCPGVSERHFPTALCESLKVPGVPEEDGHHVETGLDLLNP